MATRKNVNVSAAGQASLPFAALQLLAPPVRLVSAALWKVMQQRDVMQYGIVEEFVTSACDTVPGLLTLRHRAKLSLGLRARLILELCKQPEPKTIAFHLKRIQVPVPSSTTAERDIRIQDAVKHFHAFVPMLLADKAMRKKFFKEKFPVDFGPKYDQELEKLLWEFLIRLDQLLPVPNLAQTVSWLSEAPPVLEECARSATQPQLLKLLLQHQSCLGHLETAASLPPNMGDSILASISLPPSGKLPSNEPTESEQSPSMSHNSHKTSFIKPVFGLLSNENVPFMISASQRLQSSEMTDTNDDSRDVLLSESNIEYTKVKEHQLENVGITGLKRKHTEDGDSASEEEILRKARCVKRRTNKNLQQISDACRPTPSADTREMLKSCLHDNGLQSLQIPDDDSLCAVWVSCIKSCPKVKIEKILFSSTCDQDHDLPEQSSLSPIMKHNRVSTQTRGSKACISVSEDKENTPMRSRSQRPSLRLKRIEYLESPGESDDYVADSEDEATKNFKGRLFAKRYCKTKHGTYVPTLREYWKPCAERRALIGPCSKRR